KSVRDVAAMILASLGDARALTAIRDGVAGGLYSDADAANLFALAGLDHGGAYLEPYLDTGSERARTLAVEYLGRSPRHHSAVRTRVLLDATDPDAPRAAAARVLGQYDPSFVTYAPDLLTSTTLPSTVYVEVAQRFVQRNPAVTPGQAASIARGIDVYRS